MKKSTKFSIICLTSILTISAIILATTIPLVLNKDDNLKAVLTKEKVKDNFSINGIWANKKELMSDDFYGYSKLSNDAFDDLDFELNSIELPSSIKIVDNKKITWKQIKLIKIKKEERENIFSINNIIFSKINDNELLALTIDNRKENINILFPNSKSVDKYYFYSICDYFYDQEIFNNINEISFSNNSEINIKTIGIKAFENCKKFNGGFVWNLPNLVSIPFFGYLFKIKAEAFKNSNIEKFEVLSNQNDFNFSNAVEFIIESNAFELCNELKTIKINLKQIKFNFLTLEKESFKNCFSLKTISITNTLALIIRDNAFNIDSKTSDKINREFYFNQDVLHLENNIFNGNYDFFQNCYMIIRF